MAKYISFIVLLSLTYCNNVNGQAMFGVSMNEVKKEYPNVVFTEGVIIEKGDTLYKYLFRAYPFDECLVRYYFNLSDSLLFTIIAPLTPDKWVEYIEDYNKRFTIVTDLMEWNYKDEVYLYSAKVIPLINDGRDCIQWSAKRIIN